MTSAVPSASCPKCGATNVESVPVRRAGAPTALAAEHLRGTVAAAGTILQSVCGRCGCRWTPRTAEEHHLRAVSGQLGSEAMRAALAEDMAASAKARWWSVLQRVPKRFVAIAVAIVVVALLVLLT